MRSVTVPNAAALLASILLASPVSAQVHFVAYKFTNVQLSVGVGGNAGPQAIALGDVDNENKLDVLVAERDGNMVTFFLNDGNGGFSDSDSDSAETANGPVAVATGDFNRDSNLDIVTANNSGTVSVILADPEGGFFDQPDDADHP